MILDSLDILSESKGKTERELEYAFVGLIKDHTQLRNAEKVEEFEQWFLGTNQKRNTGDVSGLIRVRSINNSKFLMAVKKKDSGKKTAGMQDVMESEIEITKDMFNAFKELAPNGIVKTRYTFPIPNSKYKWEVDVHVTDTGETSDWCKLDLEVRKPLSEIPHPPIDLEVFINTEDKNKNTREYANKILDKLLIKRQDSILPI